MIFIVAALNFLFFPSLFILFLSSSIFEEILLQESQCFTKQVVWNLTVSCLHGWILWARLVNCYMWTETAHDNYGCSLPLADLLKSKYNRFRYFLFWLNMIRFVLRRVLRAMVISIYLHFKPFCLVCFSSKVSLDLYAIFNHHLKSFLVH